MAIAIWTVVFHLSRIIGIQRDIALLIWIVFLFFSVFICHRVCRIRNKSKEIELLPALQERSRIVSLGALLLCAAALAWLNVDGLWWPLFWVFFVFSLGFGLRIAWRSSAKLPTERSESWGSGIAVVILAVVVAALSLVMVRPDQDDVFVVNRSTWVSEHPGTFPERDTIFSEDFLPSERPASLPTSVEALLGSVAAHLPVSAPGLVYLFWAPLISALGVFANWRLLRFLGARSPAFATWVGAVFLFLDGKVHGSFGNFFVGRAWQGKATFLLIVIPALWYHAASWGSRGNYRNLMATLIAVVAGLGLTTSAAFVSPAVLVAATAATALSVNRFERLSPAFIVALPALAAGFYAFLSEAQHLNEVLFSWAFIDIRRFLDSGVEPLGVVRFVFGSGLVAFITIGCVLTAWLVVQERSTRLLLLFGPVVVFIGFLAPGVLDLMNEIGDADAVAWRVLWILPLPVMVGLVLSAPKVGLRIAQVGIPVVALILISLIGTPIISENNRGAELVWPPTYDLPRPEATSAVSLIEIAGAGNQIAGPEDIDFAVAVLTSKVRTTNPRSSYLVGRHVSDGFAAEERAVLSRALDFGIAEYGSESVVKALYVLTPDAVCLRSGVGEIVAEILHGAGYREVGEDGTCRFWVRR
tara:strand:- start:82 stop:2007 length:1926 start_codon:yes stop_codon:yes gene_type:complete